MAASAGPALAAVWGFHRTKMILQSEGKEDGSFGGKKRLRRWRIDMSFGDSPMSLNLLRRCFGEGEAKILLNGAIFSTLVTPKHLLRRFAAVLESCKEGVDELTSP